MGGEYSHAQKFLMIQINLLQDPSWRNIILYDRRIFSTDRKEWSDKIKTFW